MVKLSPDISVKAFKGMTKVDPMSGGVIHMVDVTGAQTENLFAPYFRFFTLRTPDEDFPGFQRRIVLLGQPEKIGSQFIDGLQEYLQTEGAWGSKRFNSENISEKLGGVLATLNRKLFPMKAFIRLSAEEYQLFHLAEPAREQRDIRATVQRSYEQNTPLEFRYQARGDTPGFIRRVTVRGLNETGFKAKHALGYRRYRWDRVEAATSEAFKGGVGRELVVHVDVDAKGEGRIALTTVGQEFVWPERERSKRRRRNRRRS